MDRLAQTALSAIRQMQDNKFDLAHNLANVNVPGFREIYLMKATLVFYRIRKTIGKGFAT